MSSGPTDRLRTREGRATCTRGQKRNTTYVRSTRDNLVCAIVVVIAQYNTKRRCSDWPWTSTSTSNDRREKKCRSVFSSSFLFSFPATCRLATKKLFFVHRQVRINAQERSIRLHYTADSFYFSDILRNDIRHERASFFVLLLTRLGMILPLLLFREKKSFPLLFQTSKVFVIQLASRRPKKKPPRSQKVVEEEKIRTSRK